jgi:hypothetical protein
MIQHMSQPCAHSDEQPHWAMMTATPVTAVTSLWLNIMGGPLAMSELDIVLIVLWGKSLS